MFIRYSILSAFNCSTNTVNISWCQNQNNLTFIYHDKATRYGVAVLNFALTNTNINFPQSNFVSLFITKGAELALAGNAPTVLEDLSGLAGQEVSVPCSVDVATCGDFHSVKWYRESQRVFVYSELANLERSEGSLTNRYFHSFSALTGRAH